MVTYPTTRMKYKDFAIVRAILHRYGRSSLRSVVIRSGMSTDKCGRLLRKMIQYGVVLKYPKKNSIGAIYDLNEFRPYQMRVVLMISKSTRILKLHVTGFQGKTLRLSLDFKQEFDPYDVGEFINEQCLEYPQLEKVIIEIPGYSRDNLIEDSPIPEMNGETFLPILLREIEPPHCMIARIENRHHDHHEEIFLLDPHDPVNGR